MTIKSIAIAVLFLHLMLRTASDAITPEAPCTLTCLYNEKFCLKHVPTGKYITYRTDGQGSVRMATKDDMQSSESCVFCSLPYEHPRYSWPHYMPAVDYNIVDPNGNVATGELYHKTRLNRFGVRAHRDNDRGIFNILAAPNNTVYISWGQRNRKGYPKKVLKVDENGELIVEDRLPEEDWPGPAEPFAMEQLPWN